MVRIFFATTGPSPHVAKPAATLAIHHATADAADIIRYDYGSTAMRLRLYETVDFALLRIEEGGVDVLKLSQDKRQAAITTIAGGLLNRPAAANAGASPEATWLFKFPESIEDGSRFSTDASQEPQAMPSWASRCEWRIRAGHLYIFCFKRRQSGDGRLILLNDHHWFDGQAWVPYQRRRAMNDLSTGAIVLLQHQSSPPNIRRMPFSSCRTAIRGFIGERSIGCAGGRFRAAACRAFHNSAIQRRNCPWPGTGCLRPGGSGHENTSCSSPAFAHRRRHRAVCGAVLDQREPGGFFAPVALFPLPASCFRPGRRGPPRRSAPATSRARAVDERAASPPSPWPSRPLAQVEPDPARRFEPFVAGVAWRECWRAHGAGRGWRRDHVFRAGAAFAD